MEMINVLWVNNGKDELLSFLSDANEHGIEIRTCNSMKECRAHLTKKSAEHWDAVMLNYNVKREDNKSETNNECVHPNNRRRRLHIKDELADFVYAIKQLEDLKIAYYVVCDETLDEEQEEQIKDYLQIFRAENDEIYCLSKSSLTLIEDIVRYVNNSPEYCVRKKYSDVHEFCNHPKLMEILIKYESGEVRRDDSIPNSCRDILEWLEKTELFKDYGLKYKDISTEIGKKLNVPPHVKRSFHFCVEVSNEGSHGLQTNKWIQDGAPYLNASLILNLLNVLHWCSTLDKNTFEL